MRGDATLPGMQTSSRAPSRSRGEREEIVLDTAAELFYARGVHAVGMDELVRATGLGKASVYRIFPGKDALVGAYLRRLADTILAAIDADIARHADDPAGAIRAVMAAIETDLRRPGFRGCPFNNASIEFADPEHPARRVARDYRAALLARLVALGEAIDPAEGAVLGARLAVIIDGAYTSAAHLGAAGPASSARSLAEELLREAS